MAKTVNPSWEQAAYAFYEDGTEAGATLIGGADAQQTLTTGTAYHCRIAVNETAGATGSPALTLRWQYNLAAGGWTDVSGTSPLQFVDNGNLTDGGTTTNRDPVGTGTFVAGRIYETLNDGATFYTSSGSDHSEAVLHFQIDAAQVTDGQEILVRVVEGDGTALDTYTVNADIDVNEASPTTVTLVADSFTLTDGALSVTTGARFSLVADSFTLTDSTLSVVQTAGAEITLSPDSFTLTDGTLGVIAETETRVTLVADSFTLTDGTLGVVAETETWVTLSPESFTLTDGTLGITAETEARITPVADSLTLTDGTLSVTQAGITNIVLVADSFTLTDGSLTVTQSEAAAPAQGARGGGAKLRPEDRRAQREAVEKAYREVVEGITEETPEEIVEAVEEITEEIGELEFDWERIALQLDLINRIIEIHARIQAIYDDEAALILLIAA